MTALYTFMDFEPFDPETLRTDLENAQDVPVRRPIWGLELREETHATLQVLYKDRTRSSLLNSSTEEGSADSTTNFVITHITHERREHLQISDSFLSLYINTFGEQPRFLTVRGVLLKSKNFPWRTEWLHNYDKTMRASRTIEDSARLYLTVEDTVYEGHMVTCQVLDQAETELMSPMQFTMILTNVVYGTVGGAYFREGERSDASDTRASRGEYLANDPNTTRRHPTYDLDEHGNFVVQGIDHVGLEDLWRELSKDERRTALILAAARGMDVTYGSWQPRDRHEEDIIRDAFEHVQADTGFWREARELTHTAASMGEASAAGAAARRRRLIEGMSSGGDSRVSSVDSSLFTGAQLAAFHNERQNS